ncbi:MAG: metallophosphoesterase, partial [Phycisphaerae bacterium]|nr:metallophosphoesterase [Phycisphaerae bacterium]
MDIARFNKEILARWRRSPDDDRLFVAHVTDIHMLNPDEDRPEVLRHYPSPEIEWCRESFIRVVDDIAELAVKPDLLLITGDLTSTGDPVAWAQVFAVMEKLKISFLVCLGNHENGNQTEPTAEFQTIMTTLRGYGCPASLLRDLWTYRTTFGGYQFVILDSLLNGDLGTDQHDVLRESLAADIPTVILLHRPVICTDHPLDRLRLFDPVFEDIVAGSENVTAVLSGHIHRPAAKRHRGQMHFVGAATCFGNNCPTGYRLMCLAGGQVAWAVTRIVPGPSCKAYQGPIVHQDGGAAWEVLDGGLQRWMRVEPRAGKPAGRHECSLSEAAAHNGLCAIRGARETLMDSRQRVVKAIHFGGPDCPPISHAILPSAQYHYGKALAGILETVHEDFGWQFLPDLPRGELPPMYRMGTNVDSFGTVWKVTEEGRCGIPVEFPLKDYARHDGYVWPEFGAGTPKYRLYSGHMEGTSTEYYARGGWIVFFEQLQQLRGIESLLEDLMDEPRELFRLRDDMLKFNLRW